MFAHSFYQEFTAGDRPREREGHLNREYLSGERGRPGERPDEYRERERDVSG